MLWIGGTSLGSEAWAYHFARSQKDETRRRMYTQWVTSQMALAREKALADLSHWGGLQHMLDHFGKRAPPKAFLKAQVFGRFRAFKRFSGESMGKYVDRAEMLLADLAAVGMKFRETHEDFCVVWLLNSADVDDATYRSLLTVAGDAMEYNKVVAELRRVYIQKSQRDAKQAEVGTEDTEEPASGPSDALTAEAVRDIVRFESEACLARAGLSRKKAKGDQKGGRPPRKVPSHVVCWECDANHYSDKCPKFPRDKFPKGNPERAEQRQKRIDEGRQREGRVATREDDGEDFEDATSQALGATGLEHCGWSNAGGAWDDSYVFP